MLSQLTCKDKTKSKTHSQDSIPSFIRKTYDILEERKFPEIIDWNPEGNALVIKKPSEFCQKVLPAYFKHNNLTSFVRQLNMYNFHKRRTQNIDHVYYHELFQRGQKHLLKEIKRKNSEHNIDKTFVKSPETIESPQTPKDIPSLCYENQILKRLYNDAMTKINMLESQVQELSNQNQSLWSQIRSGESQPLMARFEKSELTQDQLPMTFGDISIPPLKLSYEAPAPIPATKNLSTTNISGFFSAATEDSGESTEVSHNSPSLHQPSMESEKCFDMTEATPLSTSTEAGYTLPALNLTPQVSQTPQAVKSFDLFASRTEMSVGQIFEAWNTEFQKENQAAKQQQGVLGKRHLDTDTFQVPEPSMKRQESTTLFAKKGLISNGLEDREFFRKMLGRNNSSANEDCEFDLLEFATA